MTDRFRTQTRKRRNSGVVAVLCLLLLGCAARHEVIAVTETNLGIDVGQTPSSQTPHAKLGFQRVEAAIVPTNRSAGEDAGNVPNGAASNAEVIMELRYSGLFSLGDNSGLYQRLAVGPDAVRQPGAAALFIRDNSGKIDTNGAAVLEKLKALETPNERRTALAQVARIYASADDATRKRMETVMQGLGYKDGTSFFSDNPGPEQINAVSAAATGK